MQSAGDGLPDAGPGTATDRRVRRRLLHRAARLFPAVVARRLARRYLQASPRAPLDPSDTRGGMRLIALGEDTSVLRHPAREGTTAPRRILLVHGHDGNIRQFVRLIRALQNAGAEVDGLILPGHSGGARTVCSMATMVRAIQRTVGALGPYDGIIGHCVSANALLFALDEGLRAGRVVFVSCPIELRTLIRLGGRQYGIGGACLESFVQRVSALGAPYLAETPWRPLAQRRHEPMLAVHSRHDYAAPVEDMQSLQATWPGARMVVVENGGHNTIVNRAPAIKSITAFLTEG
ncbi:alpha/beta fold hydrolase [Salipiger sp.]|uniref:alpha/beta fold hydrolase n=1 Tax=Salipiger sp. TaxID=2078585 RepID=UPI003A9874A0